MDILTFVLGLIKAVAWPSVVALLLLFLKPHLGGLAFRLEELTLPGGAKAKFAKVLDEAKEQTEKIVYVEGLPAAAIEDDGLRVGLTGVDRFLALANSSPEAAIMQTYHVIESIPVQFAAKIPIEFRKNLSSVINYLHQKEMLDSSWVNLFDSLRNLRNLSVHATASQRPTTGEAIEYQNLCRLLSDKIFEVFRQMPILDQI